jgi:hypothetical protein
VSVSVGRNAVLGFRIRAQQLDRDSSTVADTAVLDFGVQDTGGDGALWALACRGIDPGSIGDRELVLLWTLRGAPHQYRRADLAAVAAAVQPYSDEDAAKRIFDAAKPLKAAGISPLTALDAVAEAMRAVVTRPMVKGEVSTEVTQRLPEPYRRACRPCNAIHLYEQTFRLGATRAGLELEPDTSPPVLRRVPSWRPATTVPPRFDLVRGYLRFLGPATPKLVAEFLDAPVKVINQRWPEDAVPVDVDGEKRWVLADDVDALSGGPAKVTRLLAPFDLFLQARDRSLLVPSAERAKSVWVVLGRPGAVLHQGDLVGIWRPRQSGRRLRLQVELWTTPTAAVKRAVTEQAERLAAYRNVTLAGVDIGG